MFKIKQKPEDFIVKEISELKLSDNGKYAYFRLWKRDYNTVRALQRIAGFLRLKLRDIGFAGTKDKIAVTEQFISIKNVGKDALINFKDEDIRLEFIGQGDEPISLGDLEGNEFEILVEADAEPEKIDMIVNYFDEQRFSKNNVEIGRAIVKGDFKKAVELVDHRETLEYLQLHATDSVGAIKQIPLKIRQIFVHAYQSWLWNCLVMEYLQCKYTDFEIRQYSLGELVFPKSAILAESIQIPIIGFGTEYENEEIEKIAKKLLKQENITERDFIIRAMPELSSEGNMRDLFVKVEELEIEQSEKNKFLVKFKLGKGSYATIVIKRMFN